MMPVALLLVAGLQSVSPEASLFSDVPHVRIERYAVSGRSPSGVRREINAARLAEADGGRFDGMTNWRFEYRFQHDGQGVCVPGSVEVSVEITVTLPELAEPNHLDARERRAWDAYILGLATHERNHVRIVERGKRELERAMRSAATCAAMAAAGERIMTDVEAASREYDRRTDHGQREVPPFG